MQFKESSLSPEEYKEIKRLLAFSKHDPPEVEDIWRIVDVVWDELDCCNTNLNWEKISEFYQHPVWILNGLFTEQHKLSRQYRMAIANWITQNKNIACILDYGGGFGTLARMIAEKNKNLIVDIYEPYPSQIAVSKVEGYSKINFISSIDRKYDCLVSTDVLEHTPDPIGLFGEMIDAVKVNGFLMIGNCFYPQVKCHLPQTFHLRYSFDQFAKLHGLKIMGSCQGSYIKIYQKIVDKKVDISKIKRLEIVSRAAFPLLELFGNKLWRWFNRFVLLLKPPIRSIRALIRKN